MRRPMALALKLPARAKLDADMRKYFAACDEKIGFVPNVLRCYSFDQDKLRAFVGFYNGLIAKILSWFSLVKRYGDFSLGLLSLSPIVYYISFSGAFVFMTIRMIEKRRWV